MKDENLGAVLKALYAVFGETPFSAGQVRESQDAALQAARMAAIGSRTTIMWLRTTWTNPLAACAWFGMGSILPLAARPTTWSLAMTNARMERLLDDWGLWARDRLENPHRCRSMERNYKREGVSGDSGVPRAPIRVDEAACLAVERAVCNPEFPAQAHTLLKGWYVLRISGPKIAARAGIPRAAFESRLAWAVTILRNRLPKAAA